MMDESSASCHDALVEMDECIGMLGKEERDDLMADKAKHLTKKEVFHNYMRKWRAHKQKVSPPGPHAEANMKAGSSSSSSARAGRSSKPSPYPSFPEGMMSQPVAKAMCPRGGSIWRGLARGS